MPHKLHPKLQERKLKAGLVQESWVSIADLPKDFQQRAKESLNERVIEGYIFTWGTRNRHGEVMHRGCCAKSIRERGPGSESRYEIKFLNQHRTGEPLALFEVLEEDEIGLYFKTKPLDEVPWANNVLVQLRNGTLNNFSGGFDYVWGEGKIKYNEQDDSIHLFEIELFEGSVVTIPSDMQTFAFRSMEEVESLDEEIQSFIETLPRKDRLQAKQLFTRQKSLIEFEPLEQRLKTLKQDEPAETKVIDYNFLIQNFKLN